MERPNLVVRSRELRAYFREEKSSQGSETKLDRMLAEGKVDILQRTPERTVHGEAERGDYYLDDEKMVLSGGNPVLADSKKGTARGAVLTWMARQDRLIVDNTGSGPAVSRTQRK
jgi:lipopolysaccharide export system protein LptA